MNDAQQSNLEKALYEEKQIVNRVWAALGISTFDQAKPLAIDEHVAALKSQRDLLLKVVERHRWVHAESVAVIRNTVFFLNDYLRTKTHPGVSRLVGHLQECEEKLDDSNLLQVPNGSGEPKKGAK
jgi:hypothetical protein